jgi:hypothetical protein
MGDMHPTTFIDEELDARGWSRDMLVIAMEPHMGDVERFEAKMMVDMYFQIGPTDTRLRLGDKMVMGLSGAFGTSREFWQNLEAAWLRNAKGGPR